MTWSKITRGHYRLDDTPFAVQSDGYDLRTVGAEEGTGYEGFTGGEWAVIDTRTDDNVDWFPTMREARAAAEALAARERRDG